MDNKSIKKGNHGEEHFLDFELLVFFGLRRENVTDLRGNNREGEILLPDGRLVEIKSDHNGNMERYGNMLVEITHEKHEGWYHHCKQNGVTNLIVEAFRGEKDRQHPYFVLHVVFDELRELIELEGHTFEKTHNGCLKVPIKRIFETCVGTAIRSVSWKNGKKPSLTGWKTRRRKSTERSSAAWEQINSIRKLKLHLLICYLLSIPVFLPWLLAK